MPFPASRLRRMRASPMIRELVRETVLTTKDLICPIFVEEGIKARVKIGSLPDMERLSLGDVNDEVQTVMDLGIPAVMLFGIPAKKDDEGTSAFDDNGIIQKTISQIRQNFGDKIVIMADVCLCQYTTSGHCGIVNGHKIDNDQSASTLANIAVSQGRAGVDTVSPSAMMDGQVVAIRTALDDEGLTDVAIMPHSAKHSSSFYSPFRDAADCAPKFGDRKTYQMPFTNAREAIREIELDIGEGADIVMIKPALAYLDLIAEMRRRFNVPVAAYSTSGEYALIKGAAMQGWLDEKDTVKETLFSIKRSGADMIITYFAKQIAESLHEE